jgi:peptide-methionine (S)-S-oxide reductase
METIVLGGGCFWCLDTLYRSINGVSAVVSGYAGGHDQSPNYESVSSGRSGHAEVVQLTFDPNIFSLITILEVFWSIHDPTTIDQQGADIGTQYRSIVLYTDADQKTLVEATKTAMQQYWPDPIVTKIVQLEQFYPAEDYHQDYFAKNPESAYCQLVINPKIAHFKQKFANLLS